MYPVRCTQISGKIYTQILGETFQNKRNNIQIPWGEIMDCANWKMYIVKVLYFLLIVTTHNFVFRFFVHFSQF